MKISYNQLKKLTDIHLSVAEVAEILTNTGLEVEHIEEFESIKGGLKGVVVGYVVEKQKHPNADKLSVCKVDIGSEIKQIVCGASNVNEGQKVLVATVGSTIYPVNGSAITLQKVKIRGQVSEGMICAEDELGLGLSHDGIMVLPEHYETGKPAYEYFENYTDYIIEIGLTANRGDAAGHLGVARDLKAVTGCKINLPEINIKTPDIAAKEFKITIADTEGCKRYSGIYIEGVEVKDSPGWLKSFLKSIGLTPINNIVDITNYTLHLLGQPIHAFDADTIKDNRIVVKKTDNGIEFTTLDKIVRKLNGNECMIYDAEKPLAMAGIFGGLNSGITNNTKNIFIESAYFDPTTIRKSAKHHGLSTDASFRYERGTDPNITQYALKFVTSLILDLAGGSVGSSIIDVYAEPINHKTILFNISRHNSILGENMPVDTIKEILKNLDISIIKEDNEHLHLSVPPYRHDVTRDIDITEEILRIYGLNKIPISTQIKSAITHSYFEFGYSLKNKISNMLASSGFLEIATNTLTKQAYLGAEINQLKAIKILNPLSNDLEFMRTNMLYSMLEVVHYNKNRKQINLNFFEFGKTYHLKDNQQTLSSYSEKNHLCILMYGNKKPESWNNPDTPNDIYRLKQIAEKVLTYSGIKKYKYQFINHEDFDTSATISFDDTPLAVLGMVNNKILKQFDIEKPVWYIDFDADSLISISKNQQLNLKPVSIFPSVRRDLALVLDKSVKYADLVESAYKVEKLLLKDVNVFDVYEGDKIPEGKKSYALSFVLQDEEKTLTDDVIDNVMKKILKQFEKDFNAILR